MDKLKAVILLLTHRLYIANKYASKAVVFEDGKITENDKVSNLMSSDSKYNQMMAKTAVQEANAS